METSFNAAGRLWHYPSPPDNNVYNSFGVAAEMGDYFVDTLSTYLYFCVDGTTNAQVWSRVTYNDQLQAAIAAIPQADWNQSNTSASNYIKNKPTIPPAQIQSDWAQSNSAIVDFIKNKPTIPAAQIQSDWTQTNTSSLDYIKNKPAAMSQSAASRTLNTIFQPSATRWTNVRYSIDISTTVSLTGGAVGRVVLEMATNAGFTTGVQELQSFGNGNTGTLVVGLVLTQLTTACLSGQVPPGNYVRIRTVNVTGSPSYTYISGQEVLL
jgi:hypothetical protein